jgi:hypothetical protein
MRHNFIFISVLFLGLSATSAGAVELITNGGFEAGNFTPVGGGITTYDTITQGGPQDLTGWTVENSLVWGFNVTDINTHAGNGYVDLTGVGDTTPHGILSQTISTIVGQNYSFSIFETQDFGGPAGFDVFANGIMLALLGVPGFWDYSATGATYGQLTSLFTATSASTTIKIVGHTLGSRQFMIGLDDVSVTGPAVSTVPLPAAFPLLSGGLAALGFLARRRRSKNGGCASA